MKCRLLNVLAGVSLVLFVIAVAMWVRSYFVCDEINGDRTRKDGKCIGEFHAASSGGGILLVWMRLDKAFFFPHSHTLQYARLQYQPSLRLGGFAFTHGRGGEWLGLDGRRIKDGSFGGSGTIIPGAWWTATVPWYAPVILVAMMPMAFAFRILKASNLDPRYCPKCGYDLRATPDRCPECGAITPKKDLISN